MRGLWERLVGTLWRSGAQRDEEVLLGRNGDSGGVLAL